MGTSNPLTIRFRSIVLPGAMNRPFSSMARTLLRVVSSVKQITAQTCR